MASGKVKEAGYMRSRFTSLILYVVLSVLPLVATGQNLFVSSHDGYIYEITPQGVVSTFASNLSNPNGLAFDSSGNLFEADYGSGNIYEFTPQGVRSTYASGLNSATGLAFDGAGNLYVSSYFGSFIYRITPQGVQTTIPDTGAYYLTSDKSGNVYAADNSSGSIYQITPQGTKSTYATFKPTTTTGLALDASGNVFLGIAGGSILELTPPNNQSLFASDDNVQLLDLAFGGDGYLYASTFNSSYDIKRFDAQGNETTFVSGISDGGGLAFAPLAIPEPATLSFVLTGLVFFSLVRAFRNRSGLFS